jgi:hypothetical protein
MSRGWEWLSATIIGVGPTELIAVRNRSHNQWIVQFSVIGNHSIQLSRIEH